MLPTRSYMKDFIFHGGFVLTNELLQKLYGFDILN